MNTPIVGRHLIGFDCALCGHVEHDSALQILEVLICMRCIIKLITDSCHADNQDECPVCWPDKCGACGVPLSSGTHHREHIKAAHR